MKSSTISLLLILISCGVWAQHADTLEMRGFRPTGIRVGADLISLLKIPLSDQFDGWEVSADIDFSRYYFTVEAGNWEKNFASETQQYSNSGNYFRVGFDVNLLLKDPDKNMFFIGLRYARASFQEQLNYFSDDLVFGNRQQTFSNESMKAGWGEATLGLRVKIWREFWMGYTARLKVAPSVGTKGQFSVYDIPGYGLASKNTYWGFNYQLYWRFARNH